MPELPEVESARREIEQRLLGRRIVTVEVRERRLRWPVSRQLGKRLAGQVLCAVGRRAKYLLLETPAGTALVHLGMSGHLRLVPATLPVEKHDHLDIVMDNRQCLRLNDPRRFGAVLWCGQDPSRHRLLRHLGPEPLTPDFTGEHLHRLAQGRRLAVKNFIMNARVVVGVGNIYASESLYLAGVHPGRAAGRISRDRYQSIARCIQGVLSEAIRAGGTTLRDFYNTSGEPGTFSQRLEVYGRVGEPCGACGSAIRRRVIGQRSSYFCPAVNTDSGAGSTPA